LLSSDDGGTLIRLIAGDLGGHQGPGSTRTPIVMVHATLAAGAQMTLPWSTNYNALAYVLAGSGSVGMEGAPVTTGQLAVFVDGDSITLRGGANESLDVLLLGGEPIGEPIAAYGPFVMNTKAELQQAFEDFQRGLLGVIPADGIQPFRGR
jgi:redox-sensitive bicupin YhaK (pirin superfamily)